MFSRCQKALRPSASCSRGCAACSTEDMGKREIFFPSSGPLKDYYKVRFYDRLRVIRRVKVTWKGKRILVPIRGDFEIMKLKPSGEWEEPDYSLVPEHDEARYRLEFNCAELIRGKRLPVHQFIYFVLSSKYTKDSEGWSKFTAETADVEYYTESMTVDHKGAWWQIERTGLQRITLSANCTKTKCTLKPGTLIKY